MKRALLGFVVLLVLPALFLANAQFSLLNSPPQFISNGYVIPLLALAETTASAENGPANAEPVAPSAVFAGVTTNGGSGLAPAYVDIASAITALNAAVISSPVVITASGVEIAPPGGFVITATGTAVNTITIDGAGATTITAGLQLPNQAGTIESFDGIFKIHGGDFITIQGFTMQENVLNVITTPGNLNTMTEFGVLLVHLTATNGAQNNTIQNNSITLNSAYTDSVGIFSTSASSTINGILDATSTAGTNSNNRIYGNTISNVAQGIVFICPPIDDVPLIFETGNDVGGSAIGTANNITFGNATASSGPWNRSQSTIQAGIHFRNGAGNNVRFNTVTSNSAAYVGAAGLNGIIINSSAAPINTTYTSTISDNTVTVTTTGAALITGIDFGHGISAGTIVGSNNIVTVNQSPTAAAAGAAIGIKANYVSASNTANGNNVTVNKTQTVGNSSGDTTGITTAAAAGISNSGNSNTITINQTTSGTGTMSGAITALRVAGAAETINALTTTILINQTTSVANGISTPITGIAANAVGDTVNVTTNNAITIRQAVTGAGTYSNDPITYIDVDAASGTVNVMNNNLNTTGSTLRLTGAVIGVFQDSTVSTHVDVQNNTMNVDRVATAGSIIFQSTTGGPVEVKDTISNNIITFTSLAGITTATAINSLGGPVAPALNNKTIIGNTINISGTHTGLTIGITCDNANTGFIQTNSVTVASAATTVTGITTTGAVMTISGNTLSLTSSTTAPIAMTGINETGTGAHSITNNTFSAMNFTGVSTTGPTVSGIAISAGTGANIFGNTVTNISVGAAGSTGTPVISGVFISGGTSINVFRNRIYGLSSGANGTSGPHVNGVRISAGTTNNVFNNLIGNLTANAAVNGASGDTIRGINITSTTSTSSHNISFNTVYLNALAGGLNFGTTGVFHTTDTIAGDTTLNMRSNIIVNTSIANGTGLTVAYRRSSTTLTNYGAVSNNNLFYSGTPSATNLIYADGTNSLQTLANYQALALLAPRDNASVTGDPQFLSTVGANVNFLHINTALVTPVSNAGITVAGITDDFDGNTRPAAPSLTPDIGADEFIQAGVIQFSSATYSMGEAGPNLALTVNRTDGTEGAVGATFSLSGGTAAGAAACDAPTPGIIDYVNTGGTVSFGDGSATPQVINVPLCNDIVFEGDETFGATLSLPTGGVTLGAQTTATATITDNDGAPTVSISDVSQAEGNAGPTNFVFTVSNGGSPSQAPIVVDYHTVNGSAIAPGDFTDVPAGQVTIPSLAPSTTITITVSGDTTVEPDETFTVVLDTVSVGTITDGTGVGTILNDDCTPAPGGMVLWHKAESNTLDSANSNDGILVGDTTYVTGRVGQAYSLDGTGDYVDVQDSLDLQLPDAGFTIDLWFRPSVVGVSQILLSKGVSDLNEEYTINLLADGSIYWDYGDLDAFVTTGPLGIAANQWYHLAVVYDPALAPNPRGRVYLNGVLQANVGGDIAGHTVSSGSSLYIGTQAAGVPYYAGRVSFNGLLDEIEIIGSVLSQPEIQAIYDASGAGKCAIPTAAYVVDNTDSDTGLAKAACTAALDDCSLRGALSIADDGDTITFSSVFNSPQTIALGGSTIGIIDGVTITGPGANLLIITGNDFGRVFSTLAGDTLSISGMTIANGNSGGASGGAVANSALLTLNAVTIRDSDSGSLGGGIYCDGAGSLTIINSTISGNTALDNGGGIQNNCALPFSIIGSTISGNTSGGQGGGLRNPGPTETGTITDTTITNNSAVTGAGGVSAGNVISPVTVRNSIIADNVNNAVLPDVAGTFTSGGFNIIGNGGTATGFVDGVNGDQVGPIPPFGPEGGSTPLDPMLGPLQDNGGPTFTHIPEDGGPGHDAGCAFGVATDQRGNPRTVDWSNVPNTTCSVPAEQGTDIGAIELLLPTSAQAENNGRILTARGRGIANVVITVTNQDGEFVSMGRSSSFGYYTVRNVPVGESYIITVHSKRFTFGNASRVIMINNDLEGVDFVADR